MNLILINTHLILSNLFTPFINQINNKLHCIIPQKLDGLFLIKIIFNKYLLNKFSVKINAFSFYHVERLAIEKFFLDLVLRKTTFFFKIVDNVWGWVHLGVDLLAFNYHCDIIIDLIKYHQERCIRNQSYHSPDNSIWNQLITSPILAF